MSKRNRKVKSHAGEGEVVEQEVFGGGSIELSTADEVTINEVEDSALFEERRVRGELEDAGITAPAEDFLTYSDPADDDPAQVGGPPSEECDEPAPGDDQVAAFESAMSGAVELTTEETIAALRAELENLQKIGESRRIKSGSKPRPNTTYTLLTQPPQWSSTPQLAQIQQILFSNQLGEDGNPLTKMTEPQLFELLEDGKVRGALRTNQPAVRVFQYYRNRMLKENVLRWE